jgi:phosphohistidine phosphatase SixA
MTMIDPLTNEPNATHHGTIVEKGRSCPDIIISSTTIRARATSEAIAKASSYDGEIVLEKSLYAAGPGAYLGTLCQMNMFEC